MKFKSMRDRIIKHIRKVSFRLEHGNELSRYSPHCGCAIGTIVDSYGMDKNESYSKMRQLVIDKIGLYNGVHLEAGFEGGKYTLWPVSSQLIHNIAIDENNEYYKLGKYLNTKAQKALT